MISNSENGKGDTTIFSSKHNKINYLVTAVLMKEKSACIDNVYSGLPCCVLGNWKSSWFVGGFPTIRLKIKIFYFYQLIFYQLIHSQSTLPFDQKVYTVLFIYKVSVSNLFPFRSTFLGSVQHLIQSVPHNR